MQHKMHYQTCEACSSVPTFALFALDSYVGGSHTARSLRIFRASVAAISEGCASTVVRARGHQCRPSAPSSTNSVRFSARNSGASETHTSWSVPCGRSFLRVFSGGHTAPASLWDVVCCAADLGGRSRACGAGVHDSESSARGRYGIRPIGGGDCAPRTPWTAGALCHTDSRKPAST